jgi:hypothetical protein
LNTFSFVDSNERPHLFSGKLGSATWKEKLEIKSNSFIIFNARTTKDLKANQSFFLKFSVSAIGFEHMIKRTIFKDLTESLTCLFGSHMARAYSERLNSLESDLANSQAVKSESTDKKTSKNNETNAMEEPIVTNTEHNLCGFQHQLSVASLTAAICGGNNDIGSLGLVDNQNKLADLNSFFYKTLLRGGFNQNYTHLYEIFSFEYDDIQIQAKSHVDHVSLDEESNLKLLKFLNTLAFYFENHSNNKAEEENSNEEESSVVRFLKVYDKNYDTSVNALNYAKTKVGGASITELVLRIFCVLIWHNSSITYESLFATNEQNELVRNEAVAHAYKAAESTRMFIIEQQQMFKLKYLNGKESEKGPTKSLIDILNEKVIYLLKFERLNDKTLNYEINKSNVTMKEADIVVSSINQHNPQHLHHHHSANSVFNKKKKGSRYPKYELVPAFNVVFDFIFDKNINNLEFITSILNLKRSFALLITKNLNLAARFLSIFISAPHDRKKNTLECLLTYLSNFFSAPSSLQFSSSYTLKPATSSSSSSNLSASSNNATASNKNLPNTKGIISFPPTLQFGTVHYLQNLYACGIKVEQEVQNAYFKLLTLLINYSNSLKKPLMSMAAEMKADELNQKILMENLIIRFDCFLISFLDIDWETNDLKFIHDLNVIAYLVKNASKCMPIDYYKSETSLTPSQVLEDIFRLSKEKFNESISSAATAATSVSNSKLSVVEEESSFNKEEDAAVKNLKTENQKTSETSKK